MLEARAEKLALPRLEDANAIQMAVMLVQRALIDDEISEKKAGLLLYSLQIAAANVDKTTFGQAADEDLVTDTVMEDDAITRHAEFMERQKKLAEIKERRISPLIDGDNADLGNGVGKMLPQPADMGSGGELRANLG